MPQLIKNIKSEYTTLTTGSVNTLKTLNGVVKLEDYIELYGFVAYLQNFTKIEDSELLIKPLTFGLKNRYNLLINNLEIDY